MVTEIIEVNMALDSSTDHRNDMALKCSMDHWHNHGSWWQYTPKMSTWPPETVDVHTDLGHPHDLGWQHKPHTAAWIACTLSIAWITDTNIASRDSTDHVGLLRRPSLENKPFYILDILSLLKARVILCWIKGAEPCQAPGSCTSSCWTYLVMVCFLIHCILLPHLSPPSHF